MQDSSDLVNKRLTARNFWVLGCVGFFLSHAKWSHDHGSDGAVLAPGCVASLSQQKRLHAIFVALCLPHALFSICLVTAPLPHLDHPWNYTARVLEVLKRLLRRPFILAINLSALTLGSAQVDLMPLSQQKPLRAIFCCSHRSIQPVCWSVWSGYVVLGCVVS